MLSLKNIPKPDLSGKNLFQATASNSIPTEVNWVTAGKVNAVKNQG